MTFFLDRLLGLFLLLAALLFFFLLRLASDYVLLDELKREERKKTERSENGKRVALPFFSSTRRHASKGTGRTKHAINKAKDQSSETNGDLELYGKRERREKSSRNEMQERKTNHKKPITNSPQVPSGSTSDRVGTPEPFPHPPSSLPSTVSRQNSDPLPPRERSSAVASSRSRSPLERLSHGKPQPQRILHRCSEGTTSRLCGGRFVAISVGEREGEEVRDRFATTRRKKRAGRRRTSWCCMAMD